jgi:hypothetical protein
MGATDFRLTSRGVSVREAFQDAVEAAEFENGHDSYNGTISTTEYYGDLTDKFKKSGKSINSFIDEFLESCSKHHCYSICIESPEIDKGKIKSKVEHIVSPGTKKWILKYVVIDLRDDEKVVKSCLTKGEAVKAAREHTEKTTRTTVIEMQKVLEKGSNIVAKVTYKGKRKQGVWVLFGVAAD